MVIVFNVQRKNIFWGESYLKNAEGVGQHIGLPTCSEAAVLYMYPSIT